MTPAEIKAVLVEAIQRVAPEIEASSLRPDVRLRDQVDLDSMDFLNFVVALHDRLGVEIPESDYPRLDTLDEAAAYLAEKTGAT